MNYFIIQSQNIYNLFLFQISNLHIPQKRRFFVKTRETCSSQTRFSLNMMNCSFFGRLSNEICNDPRKLAEWIHFEQENTRTNRHGCRADHDCVCPRRDKRRRAPLLRTSNRQRNILVASIVPLPVSWPSIIFPLLHFPLKCPAVFTRTVEISLFSLAKKFLAFFLSFLFFFLLLLLSRSG